MINKRITLRDIFYAIFKNLNTILLIFIFCIISSVIYSFTVQPIYKAETKLLVKLGREKISSLEEYSKSSYNILFQERAQNINNEIEILKGEELALRVFPKLKEYILTKAHPKQNFLTKIKKQYNEFVSYLKNETNDEKEKKLLRTFISCLKVEFLPETDLLKLSFKWDDPNFAAFVVNTYVNEFISFRTEVYQSKKTHGFYLEQTSLYENSLKEVQDELGSFMTDKKIANIDIEKELLLRAIDNIESQYLDVLTKYNQTNLLIEQINKWKVLPNVWIETPNIGPQNIDKQAYLGELDKSYFILKIERENLLKKYTSISPEIINIDKRMSELKIQKAHSILNILLTELIIQGEKKVNYEKELAQKKERLQLLNDSTNIIKQLVLKEDLYKHLLTNYRQKAEDLRIYDDLDKRKITSISILYTANPPFKPVFPKKALIISISCFLGLFLSSFIVALIEFFNNTFKQSQDIEEVLGISNLMTIPFKKKLAENEKK